MSQVTQPKRYWRSQEELKKSHEHTRFLYNEFQEGASELDTVSRRSFLKMMGASFAFAGLAGCASIRKPNQTILPYTKRPEHYLPGQATFYATAMGVDEDVVGLLVESHSGRPTKIEGNPTHSQSQGATTAIQQASILGLYDPDRFQAPRKDGAETTLEAFSDWISDEQIVASRGKGVAVLVGTNTSPSFHDQISGLRARLPLASVYRYAAVNRDNVVEGLRDVTGQALEPSYRFDQADVILSLNSDFLGSGSSQVANTKAFSSRRDPDVKGGMNRLYVVENQFSVTGGKADHRVRVNASDTERVLWLVISRLIQRRPAISGYFSSGVLASIQQGARQAASLVDSTVVDAIVDDLTQSRGRSIVVAGDEQPMSVHSVVFILNRALGNQGRTVNYRSASLGSRSYHRSSSMDSIKSLTQDMASGRVSTLFVVGGDPVYTVPKSIGFQDALKHVQHVVALADIPTATTKAANWIVPRSHYLESWGDVTAVDGSVSLVQPLIRPMFSSLSDSEFVSRISGRKASAFQIVRRYWRSRYGVLDARWKRWLHEGIVSPASSFVATGDLKFGALARKIKSRVFASGREVEVLIKPDSRVYDGRFVNNSWLQELPDTVTKLTWDNTVWISEALAAELKVSKGDVVSVAVNGRTIKGPVWITPGQADRSVSLFLGYGQTESGVVGKDRGYDAYPLVAEEGSRILIGAELAPTGETVALSTTQDHGSMEGRALYREGSVSEYKKDPEFAKKMVEVPDMDSLWPERKYDTGYQWGMTIDLSKCTGCNACVTSCQAENNIPVVGKDEVANGREMHWIRVDRYFEGAADDSQMVQQPVTCLQCENAPCEQVCPVAATVHSEEGLNDMVYNRCVGTRYCLDNCPAKVRRFNFFDYHQRNAQAVDRKIEHIFGHPKQPAKGHRMQFNPDVTVRMRGVMEKCTYCVQRINSAKSTAANESRSVRDGDVVTACQQACPADAIVFGDILDKKSKVAKLRDAKREYSLLDELHLKPRTTYLAAIRNPHPSLVGHESTEAHT